MLQVIVNVLTQEKSPLGIWQARKVIVAVLGIKGIWDSLDQDRLQSQLMANKEKILELALTKKNNKEMKH